MDVTPEFTRAVSAVIPLVTARIPPVPAAALGRLAVGRRVPRMPGRADEPKAVAGLRSLPPLLAERLFGALELCVDDVAVPLPADIAGRLVRPRPGQVFSSAYSSGTSDLVRALPPSNRCIPARATSSSI